MKRSWSILSNLWCYTMHPAPMWPVNGYYRCPQCQREYPVPWEKGETRFSSKAPAPPPVALVARQGFAGKLSLVKRHKAA